jgi:hypothetical protein
MNRRPYRSKVSLDKDWKPANRWALGVGAFVGLAFIIAGLVMHDIWLILFGFVAIPLIPAFDVLYYWLLEGMCWLLVKLFSKRDGK